jgi:hypothetical protein
MSDSPLSKTIFWRWELIVPLILAGLLIMAGMVFAWNRFANRPFCIPQIPFRGDDPPQKLSPFTAPEDLQIPLQEDWVDYGPVLETGAEGEWDFFWAGATPASVVKKDDNFFFFYVAANGYRSYDGDARHRSIGVATSPDGIRFTKYAGNPIMTHHPYDGEEEGANSAGVTLDEEGRFVMVYGAAKGPYDLIVADGRYAHSEDGFAFTDAGQALYHCNVRLYGWGDEIFPVAVTQIENRWFVYYQPNGIPGTARTLGAAWGPSLDRLNNSTMVLNHESGDLPVSIWGNIIQLDDETLVLFNQRLWWPDTFVEVRVASPQSPYNLSEPVARYDIPNLKRGVIFLDKERRTWFMYYNDFSRYWHVKLAPYGEPDISPPTTLVNLVATIRSHEQVQLSWDPAVDVDTGVVEYRVYRDGTHIGSTKYLEWLDQDLEGDTEYAFQVTAVNFHGAESSPASVSVATPANTSPPSIIFVEVNTEMNQVKVVFDRSLNPVSATELTNYSISNGVKISRASIENDNQTVLLDTSSHVAGNVHTLTVYGVTDMAQSSAALRVIDRQYTASPAGSLVGRWLASDLADNDVPDVSGFGWDGWVNEPLPDDVRIGSLYFDGSSSYVQIPGDNHLKGLTDNSFSFAAWVRPDSTPSSFHGARIIIRVSEHPAYYYGVSFSTEKRFQALIYHPDENRTILNTPEINLGEWYHIIMVVDTDATELNLYLDGEPVPGSPQNMKGDLVQLWSDPPRDDRSGAYFIGSTIPDRGAGSFFDAYFHGAVADVRFYDRALEQFEVKQLWVEWQP